MVCALTGAYLDSLHNEDPHNEDPHNVGQCFGTRKTIGVKEVHLITNDLTVRRR